MKEKTPLELLEDAADAAFDGVAAASERLYAAARIFTLRYEKSETADHDAESGNGRGYMADACDSAIMAAVRVSVAISAWEDARRALPPGHPEHLDDEEPPRLRAAD